MGLRDKGFWNSHYELELQNYELDGDEGDVWFGKPLSRRIANWIVPRLLSRGEKSSILDVGCGNSFTLRTILRLYENQSTSIETDKLKFVGIDFASNSIELSRKILESQSIPDQQIQLSQCDFLDKRQLEATFGGRKYDYIIDIGTYDAICLLSTDNPPAPIYMQSVCSLIKDKTILILASCNHTEEELSILLDLAKKYSPEMSTTIIDRIESPKYKFGGKEGSQVCCLIIEFNA